MNEMAMAALAYAAAKYKATGLAAAASNDGKLVFEGALGLRDKANGLPATAGTVFRMASLTKPISAMTLLTLADEGKADLDADIGDYLGYRVRNPHWPDVPLTLRQLMTHTSSLTDGGSYARIVTGELPAWRLSEVLKPGGRGDSPDNWLPDRPGTRYDYSSFGTGVMGAVGERISGMKFAELVRRRLFIPLGLDDASLDAGELSGAEVAAPDFGTGLDAKRAEKTEETKRELCALPVGEAYRAPQGNGYMRARDLLTVLQTLLDGGKSRGVRLLSGKAVQEMCAVQFDNGVIRVGLNLQFHNDIAPQTLIGHYGRAAGALAVAMLDPARKAAAAVLCNGAEMTPDLNGIYGNTLFGMQAMRGLWAACFPQGQ